MMNEDAVAAIAEKTGVNEEQVASVIREFLSQEEKEPRWSLWMVGACFVVAVVLAAVAATQYWVVENYVKTIGDDDVTRFGISGDFFGFANALFSALAFALLIVTLWMQKYELKQQRIELDQTQQIMQSQQGEMEQQNESLRRQAFETTFFGMLRLHSEIVSTMKDEPSNRTGRRAFSTLVSSIRNQDAKTVRAKKETIGAEEYEEWYRNHESSVGHYFRTLYNLLRYVNQYGGDDRVTYARLVRAQLCSDELKLLLYNGISRFGKEKFKPLMEEYALLKHLTITTELEHLKREYNAKAFGNAESKDAVDDARHEGDA